MLERIIREIHSPKTSDWPIGIGSALGQLAGAAYLASQGMLEETDEEELGKAFADPHYKKRATLKKAQNLVKKLEREKLIDFFIQCLYNPLEWVVPQWTPKFRVIKYVNEDE